LKQVDKLADKQKDNNVNSGKIINIDGFIRHIAAGTEYYSGHARKITQNFITAAKGQNPGPAIKDEAKLRRIAAELGIQANGRLKNEITAELGELILNELNKQQGELLFLRRAPSKRQEIWRKLGVMPTGIYHEIAATRFDENKR
jgi:carbon-monoxide dehydrogenase catalytic subunit